MKKTYIIPNFRLVNVKLESHLLVDSGARGLSVDTTNEVNANFVKESNSSSNDVWDKVWNREGLNN